MPKLGTTAAKLKQSILRFVGHSKPK